LNGYAPPTELQLGQGTGIAPTTPLVQGNDGNLYGTTASGTNGNGTVIKLTLPSTFTLLFSFNGAPNDGCTPSGGLVQDTNYDDNLYGVTSKGGTNNAGAIYQITLKPTIAKALVYSFPANAGQSNPAGSLVMDSSGNLYGTTVSQNGSIFKFNPRTSQLTWTYAFLGGPNNAAGPGNLLLGLDGKLYGTLATVAAGGGGIFSMPILGGSYTIVEQAFGPVGLMQAGDGYLYGTCSGGGLGYGTIFKVATTGSTVWTYPFNPANGVDGGNPLAGLVLGTDGYLYGTTANSSGDYAVGNPSNITGGTIFRISPAAANTEMVVGNLTGNVTASALPEAPLIQAYNGAFYGTTYLGEYQQGSVFYLTRPAGSTYALWNYTSTGEGMLWDIAAGGGSHTSATFGPNAGWSPVALSSDISGNAYILWTAAGGNASVWEITPALQLLYYQALGPETGWVAKSLSVGPDGHIQVLWNHTADNEISIWNFVIGGPAPAYQAYGPYTGWVADQLAVDLGNNTRVLWNDPTTYQASLWNIPSGGTQTTTTLGPFTGLQAQYLSAGPALWPRIAWNATGSGPGSVMYVAPDGTCLSTAVGPYSGWTPASLAVNANGDADMMFDNTSNGMALYDVPVLGSITDAILNAGSGWQAVAVAQGP